MTEPGMWSRSRRWWTLTRIAAAVSLHGFGVKMAGLLTGSQWLTSADSMAWSYQGRRVSTSCGGTHRNEGNCYAFAAGWRRRVLSSCAVQQLDLDEIA